MGGGVDTAQVTRQWCILFLYLFILSYRPRYILWEVSLYWSLDQRYGSFVVGHGGGIFRICFAVRLNELLRRHSDYQLIFSFPLFRGCASDLIMGGFCGG